MQPTSVAIIGCGKIAHSGHLPAYLAAASAGLCTLVGVCDVIRPAAEAAGAAYGVPVFTDVEEMLEQTRPEVVSITTPVVNHRDLTLAALDAGCHVLCEKPVAMNVGEAAEMIRAAERVERLLSTCFQYRYWDESNYLRERIRAGDLGHIHAVRLWGGGAYDFPVHRRSLPGGGVINHWTIHGIDLALWLLGSPEPLTASAFCHQRLRQYPAALGRGAAGIGLEEFEPSMEDFGVGLVRLEGDTAITIEANWLQPPYGRREGWELLGSRGAASIWPIRVWLDRDGQWIDDTPPRGTLEACHYGMDRLIAGFLRAVRSRGPSPLSGAEILRIQSVMDALYRSGAEGREVTLEPRRAG